MLDRRIEPDEYVQYSPNWLIRNGLYMFLIVLTLFIVLTSFIRYPDSVNSKIKIVSNPPAEKFLAGADGRLHEIMKEGQFVESGELVAYIETSASNTDIFSFENMVGSNPLSADVDLKKVSKFQFGNLQTDLTKWISSYGDYSLFQTNNQYTNSIKQSKDQIRILQRLVNVISLEKVTFEGSLALSKKNFKRDSTLHETKVLAEKDLEDSRIKLLEEENRLNNYEENITNVSLSIAQERAKIVEWQNSFTTERSRLANILQAETNDLLAKIKQYKVDFLFISSISGKISYLNAFQGNEYISRGTEVLSIAPAQSSYYAVLQLPFIGSGKVHKGQEVNISIDNYPQDQYGLLRGTVKTISLVPSTKSYLVYVDVPPNLRTTYGKRLPYKFDMQGNGEILTENISILDRVLYRFYSLYKNHGS